MTRPIADTADTDIRRDRLAVEDLMSRIVLMVNTDGPFNLRNRPWFRIPCLGDLAVFWKRRQWWKPWPVVRSDRKQHGGRVHGFFWLTWGVVWSTSEGSFIGEFLHACQVRLSRLQKGKEAGVRSDGRATHFRDPH